MISYFNAKEIVRNAKNHDPYTGSPEQKERVIRAKANARENARRGPPPELFPEYYEDKG